MVTEETFGAWLQARREEHDLTRTALAAQIGCAYITLTKIERGERRPSRELARLLANALHVPAEAHEAFVRWARGLAPPGTATPVPAGALAAERDPDQVPAGSAAVRQGRLGSHRSETTLDSAEIANPNATPPPAGPGSMPASLTPLVGRAREITSLSQLLQRADVRLVTLTGAGGVGKTRLAVGVAAHVAPAFADGVHFVALATVPDASLLLPALVQVLGLRETGAAPLSQLAEHLHARRALLVLDNFEQIVTAAPLITALLAACPLLKVLVTSRAVLRVGGEYEFPVLPLIVPPPSAGVGTAAADLLEYPAVALFVQCVQARRPDFAPTAADVATIVEICRRLDGLPLAIELAAVRVKLLPLPALLARLGGSSAGPPPARSGGQLDLLTAGARDLPARQQTMRRTIAWSYDLLTAEEQATFRTLSVFAGGWTLEAAEAVLAAQAVPAGGGHLPAALDLLAALIDNSLVRQIEPVAGAASPGTLPRWGMSEPIREYGWERLEAAGEAPAARQAQSQYYLALAEEAEAQIRSPAPQAGIEQLQREHDNLRAALGWALEGGDGRLLLRLGAALWRFWRLRGDLTEGRRWLDAALTAAPRAVTSEDQARLAAVLKGAAVLAYYQNDYERAKALSAESVALCRRLGDKQSLAEALVVQALSERADGDLRASRTLYAQARALYEELGDRRGIAQVLYEEAVDLYLYGEFAEALALSQQSVAQARGDLPATSTALGIMSSTLIELGDYATAHRVIQDEVLPLVRVLGDRGLQGRVLNNLARAHIGLGDLHAAQDLLEQALAIHRDMGNRVHIANSLHGLAVLALARGEPRHAARLFGTVQALRESMDSRPTLFSLHHVETADHHRARALLGDAAYAALLAEGRALTIDQALAGTGFPADEGSPPRPPAPRVPAPAAHADVLTEREVEVLRLIARGLSKAQVAAQLSISPHTVGAHLRSIYDKLGVSSRHAAMRYALDHGLT